MTALANITALYRDRDALPLRTRLVFTFGAVAALHAAAVVLLLAGTLNGGGQALTLGLVATAYLAGVKHSYDWDHLAAIDNSTRKFVAQKQDPVSVGFAFSLGHSSVVILAGALVVSGVSLVGKFMAEGSTGSPHWIVSVATVSVLRRPAFRSASRMTSAALYRLRLTSAASGFERMRPRLTFA